MQTRKKFYSAAIHNMVNALADVEYPITKSQLISLAGNRSVQIKFQKTIRLKELLDHLPQIIFQTLRHYATILCVSCGEICFCKKDRADLP